MGMIIHKCDCDNMHIVEVEPGHYVTYPVSREELAQNDFLTQLGIDPFWHGFIFMGLFLIVCIVLLFALRKII